MKVEQKQFEHSGEQKRERSLGWGELEWRKQLKKKQFKNKKWTKHTSKKIQFSLKKSQFWKSRQKGENRVER